MNNGALAAAVAAAITVAVVPAVAGAESKRQLDAHEHGHGTLNMAIEGKTLHMELEAPGADIIGFEHAAASDEDKSRLAAGRKTLENPSAVFSFPVEAGCKIKSVQVDYETGDDHGHEKHEKSGHSHEKHDHGKKKAHKHGDGHKHGHAKEEAQEGGHAEFHARYVFDCKNTAALTVIEFPYFSAFGNARELSVTLVTDKGQKAFEVSREQNRIDLRGSM